MAIKHASTQGPTNASVWLDQGVVDTTQLDSCEPWKIYKIYKALFSSPLKDANFFFFF